MNTGSKFSAGQMVGFGAAIVVLLLFFFPWIELNFFLASTNLSGFQIATGSGPAGTNFPGVTSLLLIPLSMLAVIASLIALVAGKDSASLRRAASALLVAAGCICVVVILYQYFSLSQQFNQSIAGLVAQKVFSYSFGAHASLVGSLVVAGGGVIDLANLGKNQTP
jgi:hypothetical protein